MTWNALRSKVGGAAHRLADRFAHSVSRRRTLLRMSGLALPRRVIFVCYGNICRSPYAQARLELRLKEFPRLGMIVESAGLYGPGRPADRRGAEHARARGLDLGRHRSRLIEDLLPLAEGDLVLVMTHQQHADISSDARAQLARVELLGDFDPADPPAREIDDPYDRPDAVFERVYAQIDRSISGLCNLWGTHG